MTEGIERYDRQKLIEGWDQKKLEQGTVTIIGSDLLAQYTALSLAALGAGTIRIIDVRPGTQEDALLDMPLAGKARSEKLATALHSINPKVSTVGISSELTAAPACYFLRGSNVVIDATNSIISKNNALRYCKEKQIPLISASTNANRGKVAFSPSKIPEEYMLMRMFSEARQDDLVSLMLGGVIAEEAKKVVMGAPLEALISTAYDYNIAS